MIKVSVVVPTYNESKNLPLLVQEIFDVIDKEKIDLEFIIVDDNSPDGTGQVAEELGKQYPVRVIRRAGKLGLGSAVIEGFRLSDREVMGVMDGDLSHDPAILNELILSLGENDITIGSRFQEGSVVEKWALWRKILSKIGVGITKLVTGAKDPLSGYFFLKRSVISDVNLTTKGYKILFEILTKGKYKRIKEFPYMFRMRKYSNSKLNHKEYILFLAQVVEYSLYKLWKK